MRCAVVDLTHRSAAELDIKAEAFGIIPVLLNELDNKPKVILSTGILTGTGAPGTGTYGWTCRNKTVYSEGRLGAYLRYAGYDALVITGSSKTPAVIEITDGYICIDDAPEGRQALSDMYLTDDTVIASVEADGIYEQSGYYVADSKVSKAFLARGAAAIVVSAKGALKVKDSALLRDTIVSMYKKMASPVASNYKRVNLSGVRFLASASSAPADPDNASGSCYAPKGTDMVYSALGINFDKALSKDEFYANAAALIKAAAGSRLAKTDIKKLGAILDGTAEKEG